LVTFDYYFKGKVIIIIIIITTIIRVTMEFGKKKIVGEDYMTNICVMVQTRRKGFGRNN